LPFLRTENGRQRNAKKDHAQNRSSSHNNSLLSV
jgi:hypothetical protein